MPCAFVRVVPVQPVGVCEPVHSLTVDATNDTPVGAVSLASGFTDCVAPCPPVDESAFATSTAGALTVGVMVEFATCPAESLTWYLMAVAVPKNVARGVNVTTPEAFTE